MTHRPTSFAGVLVLCLAFTGTALAQSPSDPAQQPKDQKEQDGSFLSKLVPGFVKSWFSSGKGDNDASGAGAGTAAGGGPPQTPSVVVAPVRVKAVGDEFTFIGRIEAIQKVAIQARVSGFLRDVAFHGGDLVKTGDPLFSIERAQYEAALDSAEASLSGAQGTELTSKRALDRAQSLVESNTVSVASVDTATSDFDQAKAATLQARSAVRQAQLNLDYTSMTAPISGKISEPLITKGNFVSLSSGALANLVQLDPIWGAFPISESQITTWQKVRSQGAQNGNTVEDYTLALILPDGERYGSEGSFSFVSNTVDASTGTVTVRIEFANPDALLLPNQNVRLVATEKNPPRLPVVSQDAIQMDRDGQSVFVLDGDTVHSTRIQTGQQIGDSITVTSGLKGGEDVVIEGLQNIGDGAKVKSTRQNARSDTSPGAPPQAQGKTASTEENKASNDGARGTSDESGSSGADN